MSSEFFDEAVLDLLDLASFRSQEPYPWHTFDGVLAPGAFDALLTEFPRRELFEWRSGRAGQYYARPHDRWYLEYRPNEATKPGSVARSGLPPTWQAFIDELDGNAHYSERMREWLGLGEYELRLTWHLGVTGSEVSPHVDADQKVGTHIFYFNTTDDWDPSWGGNLLVLEGEPPEQGVDRQFTEFREHTQIELIGNRSFVFRNGPDAWHGVRPLECPAGRYRRLFNVVFEAPGTERLREGSRSFRERLQRRFAMRPRRG